MQNQSEAYVASSSPCVGTGAKSAVSYPVNKQTDKQTNRKHGSKQYPTKSREGTD